MNAAPDVDFADLQLLAEVAQAGTLLTVARRRGVAASTLSRRMTRLESALGTRLLDRGPRGIVLHESAQGLVELAREFEVSVAAAIRSMPARGATLRGTIRLSCGDGFAPLLTKIVAELAALHPQVRFELALEDRIVDLPRREADVAIRTVHRGEPSLAYRALGKLGYGLFGAASLLARTGTPKSEAGLARLPGVALTSPLDRTPPQAWLHERLQARPVLRASTFNGQVAAVQAGVGIAALPVAVSAGLERVLPRARVPELPVYLVTRATSRTERHVEAFVRAIMAHGLEPLSSR